MPFTGANFINLFNEESSVDSLTRFLNEIDDNDKQELDVTDDDMHSGRASYADIFMDALENSGKRKSNNNDVRERYFTDCKSPELDYAPNDLNLNVNQNKGPKQMDKLVKLGLQNIDKLRSQKFETYSITGLRPSFRLDGGSRPSVRPSPPTSSKFSEGRRAGMSLGFRDSIGEPVPHEESAEKRDSGIQIVNNLRNIRASANEFNVINSENIENEEDKQKVIGNIVEDDISDLAVDVRDFFRLDQLDDEQRSISRCRWILRKILRADWTRDCFMCDRALINSCALCFQKSHSEYGNNRSKNYNAVICRVIQPKCGHTFHKHCWQRWSEEIQQCCPKCSNDDFSFTKDLIVIEKRCFPKELENTEYKSTE